ncbi:hypothetical protein [Polyangium aurulentum]|uniref:hypothetical protein n=1 Tax=Polyangium aurulentum TaxID=2567896 RepID=UPI0010ADD4FD|nr:hypothetical protein [Polyangium aurulentum]UQA57621.1 hypothetical protein E8A73_041130 [Polyangium aurulentum]
MVVPPAHERIRLLDIGRAIQRGPVILIDNMPTSSSCAARSALEAAVRRRLQGYLQKKAKETVAAAREKVENGVADALTGTFERVGLDLQVVHGDNREAPAEGAARAPAAAKPQQARQPLARPKSSLSVARARSRRPRSLSDLRSGPRAGMKPHEILIKMAGVSLGQSLVGAIEGSVRRQLEGLERESARLADKQVALICMLPASILDQMTQCSAPPALEPAPAPAPAPGQGSTGFRMRY